MDIPPIAFEKISLQEAKEILDARDNDGKQKQDWHEKRRHINPRDLKLLPATYKWIASFPREVQPRQLALGFPRIANNLACVWTDKAVCDQMLDGLIMDDRGSRQGFPQAIAAEIMALKTFLNEGALKLDQS